jgi:hypothetical protein
MLQLVTMSDPHTRVTNPKRFAPLHRIATELLDQLSQRFDVERTEGYHLDSELEARSKLAGQSVKLAPRNSLSAPLVMVFSAFPGLHTRLGLWYLTSFPTCGCDACGETVESEAERLRSMIDDLTSGRFRESIRTDADGATWLQSEFGSHGATVWRSSRSRLTGERAKKLLGESGPFSYLWSAWTARS